MKSRGYGKRTISIYVRLKENNYCIPGTILFNSNFRFNEIKFYIFSGIKLTEYIFVKLYLPKT